MTGKSLGKMIQQLLLFCYILKKKYVPCLHFKTPPSHENQVILIMIPKGEGWHYLAIKNCLQY